MAELSTQERFKRGAADAGRYFDFMAQFVDFHAEHAEAIRASRFVVEKHIPDISREFAKARQKLGLKKKNIGIDTPENRAEIEGYYTDVTEERLIPWSTAEFGTVMQIYDSKISYMTLGEQMIGVIVADPHIYEMHKSLFEFTWNDPRAYAPQASAGRSDGGSSTMSQVSTP